jgi:DNA polymerase Ligase (LigD)
MPRFVMLEHDWPAAHWDFLLEDGPVLRSWRLVSEPADGKEVAVEPNAPHRLFYLDYEGPVSGERGTVRSWDAGTFDWVVDESDRIVVELRGGKLVGTCVIDGGRCRLPEKAR